LLFPRCSSHALPLPGRCPHLPSLIGTQVPSIQPSVSAGSRAPAPLNADVFLFLEVRGPGSVLPFTHHSFTPALPLVLVPNCTSGVPDPLPLAYRGVFLPPSSPIPLLLWNLPSFSIAHQIAGYSVIFPSMILARTPLIPPPDPSPSGIRPIAISSPNHHPAVYNPYPSLIFLGILSSQQCLASLLVSARLRKPEASASPPLVHLFQTVFLFSFR